MVGTRLKAVDRRGAHARRRSSKPLRKNADARLAGYLAELAKADDQEAGIGAAKYQVDIDGLDDVDKTCAFLE